MKKKNLFMITFLFIIQLNVFGQEKLKDYLDAINEVMNQEMVAENEFNLLYQTSVNNLNADSQMEMSNISRIEAYPWESPEEYTTRMNMAILELQQKRDKEISNITNEIKAFHREKVDNLANKKQEIISSMMRKEFVYSGNSVMTSFGEFDRIEKKWTVVVRSLEKDLNYISNELYLQLNKEVIKEQYEKFSKLIKDNKITSEIHFQILKKNLTDIFQKKVTRVILKTSDNAVIAEFPIDEIVETFTMTQLVYEPSSVISE